jgi:hypothetical protein
VASALLDFSHTSGVTCALSDAALRGAAARAAGGLLELRLCRRQVPLDSLERAPPAPPLRALREVLASHASLRTLLARRLEIGPAQWEALLGARPAHAAALAVHADASWWRMSSPENDGDAAAEEAAAEAAAAADDATPLTNLTLPAAERALGRAGACAPLRLQSFLATRRDAYVLLSVVACRASQTKRERARPVHGLRSGHVRAEAWHGPTSDANRRSRTGTVIVRPLKRLVTCP